eukprot:1565352-Amphidinium_carterae.1
MLFAVRPRRTYAEILSTAMPQTESLEDRRRRERLLFYYLADVTNPDHYPWEHYDEINRELDVAGKKTVRIVFIWWLPTIRL